MTIAAKRAAFLLALRERLRRECAKPVIRTVYSPNFAGLFRVDAPASVLFARQRTENP